MASKKGGVCLDLGIGPKVAPQVTCLDVDTQGWAFVPTVGHQCLHLGTMAAPHIQVRLHMSRLRFKESQDPLQNVLWAVQHTAFTGAFLLVVFVLNQTGHMRTAYATVKAILILGILINSLYVCGYIIIACFKYVRHIYKAQRP